MGTSRRAVISSTRAWVREEGWYPPPLMLTPPLAAVVDIDDDRGGGGGEDEGVGTAEETLEEGGPRPGGGGIASPGGGAMGTAGDGAGEKTAGGGGGTAEGVRGEGVEETTAAGTRAGEGAAAAAATVTEGAGAGDAGMAGAVLGVATRGCVGVGFGEACTSRADDGRLPCATDETMPMDAAGVVGAGLAPAEVDEGDAADEDAAETLTCDLERIETGTLETNAGEEGPARALGGCIREGIGADDLLRPGGGAGNVGFGGSEARPVPGREAQDAVRGRAEAAGEGSIVRNAGGKGRIHGSRYETGTHHLAPRPKWASLSMAAEPARASGDALCPSSLFLPGNTQ